MVYRLLFPLAALNALVAAPLWLGFRVRHPAVIDSTLHGHEMLFGFALAVIAGFLSTRPMRGMAWILAGTWLAGRIVAATGSNPTAFILGIMFPVMLFIIVSPLCSPAPSGRKPDPPGDTHRPCCHRRGMVGRGGMVRSAGADARLVVRNRPDCVAAAAD